MKYISLLIPVFTSCLSLVAHAENIKYKPDNMGAYNNYINVMLVDEINSFTNKNSSPLDNGVLTVNASEVIKDYKTNELKANRKYNGKDIRIKTIATKIKEGIANKPYIIANDKNNLEYITIYIDPNDNRYLNISSGDEIDLVCKGNGVLIDSPIFNSCHFAKDYAQVIAIIVKKQTQLLTEDHTIKVTEYAKLLHMLYMINEKKMEEACINNDTKKCIMIILNLTKEIKESDLKKYNVDLNKIR